MDDTDKGLILGKGRRPKKKSTISVDKSRVNRHIPLLGGGSGTATRAVGLLGGILTYAIEQGIIIKNPVHGIRKPTDVVKKRRLTEPEYRLLGQILDKNSDDEQFATAVEIIRFLAMTGCRRGEVINLKPVEVDANGSCLRLIDSKEGASVRPIGLPILELIDELAIEEDQDFVFNGTIDGKALIGFPKLWKKLVKDTKLSDITPHVLRHSFASIANDLGFTEATIAALLGHSRGTVTGRYIHLIDTALVMAADTVAGYIGGLLNGKTFTRTVYALDRVSRKAALAQLFEQSGVPADGEIQERIAA